MGGFVLNYDLLQVSRSLSRSGENLLQVVRSLSRSEENLPQVVQSLSRSEQNCAATNFSIEFFFLESENDCYQLQTIPQMKQLC